MYISTKVPVHTAPLPSPHLRPPPIPTAHRTDNAKWLAAAQPPSTPRPNRSSGLALREVVLGQHLSVALKGTVSFRNHAHNQLGKSIESSATDNAATNADNENAYIGAPPSLTCKRGGQKKKPKRKNHHSNAVGAGSHSHSVTPPPAIMHPANNYRHDPISPKPRGRPRKSGAVDSVCTDENKRGTHNLSRLSLASSTSSTLLTANQEPSQQSVGSGGRWSSITKLPIKLS